MRISTILVVMFCGLWIAFPGHTNVYFFEDFEAYDVGDPVAGTGDWLQSQWCTDGSGEISDDISFPPGGKSAYVESGKKIAYVMLEGLPNDYYVGCMFYHDPAAKEVQSMITLTEESSSLPWIGIGVHPDFPNTYVGRDKALDNVHTDLKVDRQDWIHIVYHMTDSGTTVSLNGEKVHESPSVAGEFSKIEIGNCWVFEGESNFDYIVVADTLGEVTPPTAVSPSRKLSITWGKLRQE